MEYMHINFDKYKLLVGDLMLYMSFFICVKYLVLVLQMLMVDKLVLYLIISLLKFLKI